MKVITHRIGDLDLHQMIELDIGPEVQPIFDGLAPDILAQHDWLFPH